MDRMLVVLASAALLVTGCSTTHTVRKDDAAQWIPDAQEHLLHKSVTISTRDGATVEGTIAALDPSFVIVTDADRDRRVALSLDSVSAIRRPGNGLAVFGGFLGGAFTGGIIGGAIAASGPTEQPDLYTLGMERFANTAAGAMVGALVGGVLGGTIVGSATRTHNYIVLPGRSGNRYGEKGPHPDASSETPRR